MSVIDKLFKTKQNGQMFCTAVIVAAGSSQRMGRDKILMPLGDRPVIAHTLGAFQASGSIDEIIVVTRYESIQTIADICARYGITKASKVVRGGRTRAESSLAGVLEADKRATVIAIHDGARPFPTPMLIERVINAVRENGAVTPAVSPVDTVRILNAKGAVTSTPDRDNVALVQTPQAFNTELLRTALLRASEKELALTDDCSAVEAMGVKVTVVAGERSNIKLTSVQDVYLAERILAERGTGI